MKDVLVFVLFLSSASLVSSLQVSRCHHLCTCVGRSVKCRESDDQDIAAIIAQLPKDITELHFESSNGDVFDGANEELRSFRYLTTIRLQGYRRIESLPLLKTLDNLTHLSVEFWQTCKRCDYTRQEGDCPERGGCLVDEDSPFADSYCACRNCSSARMNCTEDISAPQRILTDKTTLRVLLWVISTSALLSNIALITTRLIAHGNRQRPLSILVVAMALSNLFVTASVMILLVADGRQTTSEETTGHLSKSICTPVYFLKHFGIYTLVILLTVIILERFARLGHRLCFTPEPSFRHFTMYVCEAWLLSFLLIIPPWTKVTTWRTFCTASYDMTFPEAMYVTCGLLVLLACSASLAQVALLFWRRICRPNLRAHRTESNADVRLILAGLMTFVLLGVPHGVVSITITTGRKPGTEVVTILLATLCFLLPLIFINYSSNAARLSDTLSTKNIECTCGNCGTEERYPSTYSFDSLNPPESRITATGRQEDLIDEKRSGRASSSHHLSADSLLDPETWTTSRSTKTKSWVESCDYAEVRQFKEQQSWHQSTTSKQRALTWSDRFKGKSTSTSGVNDVSSAISSSSERMSSVYDRKQSSSGRERSSSENATHDDTSKGSPITAQNADCKPRIKRLRTVRGFFQRALSPKRQRSKSLPEKADEILNTFVRSQSAPSTIKIYNTQTHFDDQTIKRFVVPEAVFEPSEECSRRKPGGHTYRERLASFFILAPARSPSREKKGSLSPGKTKTASCGEKLKSPGNFTVDGKSPREPAMPPQETRDVLTELPVMRRTTQNGNSRDLKARTSSGSLCSTRYSMEWDPIGSVEGYDEKDVLPPFPPFKPSNATRKVVPRASRRVSRYQAPEAGAVTERTSLYSLDWDPTSVQLRNSILSRDSLGSCGDISDGEEQLFDAQDCHGTKVKTVWV